MAALLEGGEPGDVTFRVEGEELPAHRILLAARSPVFRALLSSEMREGVEGVVSVEDVRAPVFRALLHFVYTDSLPEVRASCVHVCQDIVDLAAWLLQDFVDSLWLMCAATLLAINKVNIQERVLFIAPRARLV